MTQIITPSPFTQTIEIVATKCGECGINFGLEAAFQRKRIEDRHTFHCPHD